MRRGVLATVVFVLAVGTFMRAVKNELLTVKIVRAEEKTRDRVVYWVVNTPLYVEDPFFEVVVEAGDYILTTQRDPDPKFEVLPSWKAGEFVRGRVAKNSLYLKRRDGTEMRFVIVKRKRIPASETR